MPFEVDITTRQFVGSLRTQILNNLTKQGLLGTNRQKDDSSLLCNLKAFLSVGDEEEAMSDSPNMVDLEVAPLMDTEAVELARGDAPYAVADVIAV